MSTLKYVAALTISASIALAGCSGSSPEEPATNASSTTAAPEPAEVSSDPAIESTEPDESSEPAASSESAEGVSELTAAAATGTTFDGTGYSFTGPEGWEQVTEGITEAGLDIFVADTSDTDDFADNINVVISPAGSVTAAQVESAGVAELEGAGAGDVAVKDRVMVAGAEAAHLSAALSSEGVEYQIEQFYVTPSDQTFVVTFSFSPSVSEEDRNELAQSVLTTWTEV